MSQITEGQPNFVPDNTIELYVGQKIENGDLKWHSAAKEWTEIQTIGYKIVKASQQGLFRRRIPNTNAESDQSRRLAS
jgi:hypothetical protein